jgi:hypothetical protein
MTYTFVQRGSVYSSALRQADLVVNGRGPRIRQPRRD